MDASGYLGMPHATVRLLSMDELSHVCRVSPFLQGAGPMAAECCAKTLLPKLLRNMSAIPQEGLGRPESLTWIVTTIMICQ